MVSSSEKIYFFSDAHLGAGSPDQEAEKLRKLEELLSLVSRDEAECFILGDLFDFWFEFRGGYPPGQEKALALLQKASAAGADIRLIGGNHDWWAGTAFRKATGVRVHRDPFVGTRDGLKIYAGHGDDLAPSDWGYRQILRPILRNRISISAFRLVPPGLGKRLGRIVSGGSRIYTEGRKRKLEEEYAESARKICADGADAVFLGHTHQPAAIREFDEGRYVNVGDFFAQFSYAVLRNGEVVLKVV